MITIKEVKTQKELKEFVKFPFKLYKNSKYWVPPIISQEIKIREFIGTLQLSDKLLSF